MSKITASSLTFLLGALCSFVLNQTSTLLHAGPFLSFPDAIPRVPPLAGTVTDSSFANGEQQLDGLDCTRCTFENVVLSCAGGVFRLKDMSIKGRLRVDFKEPAKNTIKLLALLEALPTHDKPTSSESKDKEVFVKQATTATWISPSIK